MSAPTVTWIRHRDHPSNGWIQFRTVIDEKSRLDAIDNGYDVRELPPGVHPDEPPKANTDDNYAALVNAGKAVVAAWTDGNLGMAVTELANVMRAQGHDVPN